MAVDVEIYEHRHEVKFSYPDMQDLMSREDFVRGQYYREKYLARKGEMEDYIEEWTLLQKMHACEREHTHPDPNFPCNMIPLITPLVEGEVASMLEREIDYVYTTNNPAHRDSMSTLEAVSEYVRRKNNAHFFYKDYARQYILLGNGWLTVMWDKTYSKDPTKPNGYPRIAVPSLSSVIVDGRIKDYKNLQHASYIIHEIGFQDIAWARKEYGDEKAEAIARTLNMYDGVEASASVDDNNTFMLLHVWTRDNEEGNLQLIEMDSTGFVLRTSDPSEPYYGLVDNEYPFWFGRMIPRQGHFYGYGDGKLLKYMQIFINNLADEMEIASRNNAQPKTFIDVERGDMDLEQWDSDPSHFIAMTNPTQNVYTVPGQGISNVIPQMMNMLLEQAQRAPRFSDIMFGSMSGVSATATQVTGQLNQGSVGIRDKASDVQAAMQWCDRYCLRLCLEKWDVPFWISKFETNSEPEFVDMAILNKRQAVVPATGNILKGIRESFRKTRGPKRVNYEPVYKGKGKKAVYTPLDFDVRISFSSTFPRGKNELFNQIISLLQLQALDPATGQPAPFISTKIAREKMEKIVGFKLHDDETTTEEDLLNAQSINPTGVGDEVAMPQGSRVRTQPSNLRDTVPQARDNRGMQL